MPLPAGIIRPARRPAGWQAPGPRPPGDQGAPDLLPQPGEDLCYLTGEFRIFQKLHGHRFSIDDLVTAWVAAETLHGRADPDAKTCTPLRFFDLGCGIGSVLLMLAWRFPEAQLLGIEAQAESAAMARRSIRWNGVADRAHVIEGDLRVLELGAWFGRDFALVTGTPPYFEPGTGTESTAPQRALCRFEHRGGVGAYVAAGARLLAPHGRVVLCCAPGQRDQLEREASAQSLVIERALSVFGHAARPPRFFVTVLRRALPSEAGHAARRTDETLIVRDTHGAFTPAARALREAMGLPPGPTAGFAAVTEPSGYDQY